MHIPYHTWRFLRENREHALSGSTVKCAAICHLQRNIITHINYVELYADRLGPEFLTAILSHTRPTRSAFAIEISSFGGRQSKGFPWNLVHFDAMKACDYKAILWFFDITKLSFLSKMEKRSIFDIFDIFKEQLSNHSVSQWAEIKKKSCKDGTEMKWIFNSRTAICWLAKRS